MRTKIQILMVKTCFASLTKNAEMLEIVEVLFGLTVCNLLIDIMCKRVYAGATILKMDQL